MRELPVVHPATLMAPAKPLLHVPYAYVMAVAFTVVVGALFTCISVGVVMHLDVSTRTHCKVANVVPSISAVIGGTTPERYIWRLGMAFFSFPRMLDAFLYYSFFSHSPGSGRPGSSLLNRLTWFLHVWQYLSLFTLSYVSSTEYFILHRNGFISFIACSILHMVAFLLLFRRVRTPFSPRDSRSFRLRFVIAVFHILIFVTSIYLYWRHNTFCEPYMYSYYSFCEYVVVLSNVAFHSVQFLDFGMDYYITIALPSSTKHS